MKPGLCVFRLILTAAVFAAHAASLSAASARPNVVVIMTDNHGAWTLGCYGNREIRTPNIDRLAREGLLFTRAYCTQSICAPSRATFLTGLLPSQHGVHACPLEPWDPASAKKEDRLIQEFDNLPRIMARAGYDCGLSGKWHLGDYFHPPEEFHYWFTIPGGHTWTFQDAQVVWQGKVQTQSGYLTDAITDHAEEFLRQPRERPFFLWLSYNGPYGVSDCFAETHRNQYTDYYADKPLLCFPREPVNPWQKQRINLLNNPIASRGYAAAVSGVDDGVGRILRTLDELGLAENTLVVFTADQGLSGGHCGFWGMGEHADPIQTREATVRIPLIFRQPGRVPAGKTTEHLIAAYDFLPTLLHQLDLADQLPTNPPRPGRDYSPLLRGEAIDDEQVIFHEFHTTRMVRTADWKLTRRFADGDKPAGPDELYDMRNDPAEGRNLAGKPEYQKIQSQLAAQLGRFFDRYADPKYDLTREGQSKVQRRAYRRPEQNTAEK